MICLTFPPEVLLDTCPLVSFRVSCLLLKINVSVFMYIYTQKNVHIISVQLEEFGEINISMKLSP